MAENISGIIDAIAEKAAADADKIVALAEEYAAAKLAAATEEAERYLSESAADTAARCAFIRERSESNARIDRKKALAGAKADVVDEVFNAVRQKLENMPVKEAAQLFIALIEKSTGVSPLLICGGKRRYSRQSRRRKKRRFGANGR